LGLRVEDREQQRRRCGGVFLAPWKWQVAGGAAVLQQ